MGGGNNGGLDHQKDRRDRVGQVVDDVVEQGAIEGGYSLLDLHPAGQGSVAGIDKGRGRHGEKRSTKIRLGSVGYSQQSDRSAARGVQVHTQSEGGEKSLPGYRSGQGSRRGAHFIDPA